MSTATATTLLFISHNDGLLSFLFTLALSMIALFFLFYMYLKKQQQRVEMCQQQRFDDMPEMSNKSSIGLGHVLNFKNNSHRFLDMLQEDTLQNSTYSFSFPFTPPCFHTSDPLVNQQVLSTRFKDCYKKPECGKRILRDLLGSGIFLSDGAEWQHHRSVISPLFHKTQLQSYVSLFTENAWKLVAIINEKLAQDENAVIDIQHYFFRYTLDTFCEIAFGIQVNSMSDNPETEEFFDAFEYVSHHGEERMKTGNLWLVKEFFFKNKKFERSMRIVNEFVYKIIRERRLESLETLSEKKDLLSMLICNNIDITDKELRDWITNLIIAGRDTTAITLTWTFFELFQNKNQEIHDQVISEICKTLEISEESFNSRVFTPDFVEDKVDFEFQKKQRYLQKVFNETLRLYPPVPINAFEATQNHVISTSDKKQYLIKKGSVCIYSAWSTQRHPDNYENPLTFNPERNIKTASYSFLSFNGGPRICLGQEMFYVEAKVLLTILLSQFSFEIVNPENVKPKHSVILTVIDGLFVRARPRC